MNTKQSKTLETSGSTSGKIWNSVFINAFVVNMMIHLCQYAMNTLISKYAHHLSAPETLVGLVASIYAVTALVFKILSAPAIDTFNRKHVLVGAISVTAVAFLGYTFSYSIPMLAISRLCHGIGMAFTTSCCLTIASNSLPKSKMGTGIAYYTLAAAICQAFAPTVGLKLVEAIGYNRTFMIFSVILVATACYTCTMKVEFTRSKRFRISLGSIIAKEAVIPAFLVFLLNLAFSNVSTFLVLYAESLGIGTNISYYFTIYAATLFVTRPLIGKLADRFGTVNVIVPSSICFALAFLLISVSRSLPMFYLAAFISAFGYGGCSPSLQAACMRSVPGERRGAAGTTNYIGTDLGHLLGPVIAGAAVERWGYSAMWRIMIIPIALAAAVTLCSRRRLDHNGNG